MAAAAVASAPAEMGPAPEDLFADDMDLDIKKDPLLYALTCRIAAVEGTDVLEAVSHRYRAITGYDDPWADLKNPQVMLQFYRRLLPWKQLFLWLNQDHGERARSCPSRMTARC